MSVAQRAQYEGPRKMWNFGVVQGWNAEGNMLTGYGGSYQYGPVTTAAPQQPQQQRNTGDELVAELMQATQGVGLL